MKYDYKSDYVAHIGSNVNDYDLLWLDPVNLLLSHVSNIIYSILFVQYMIFYNMHAPLVIIFSEIYN